MTTDGAMLEPRNDRRLGLWLKLSSVARWTVGLSVFLTWAATMLVLSPFASPRALFPVSQRAFRLLLALIGWRARVVGVERLRPDTGYVYMMNHQSFLDHFCLAAYAPGFLVGLEKVENMRLPVYGRMVRWWGNVAIDRGDREQAIAAVNGCRGLIEQGISIGVAPEGTRSRDGRVGPFKKGGFHLARSVGAPIVPVSLVGLSEMNPDGKFLIRAGELGLVVHEPQQSDRDEPLEQLMERVRATICGVDGLEPRGTSP